MILFRTLAMSALACGFAVSASAQSGDTAFPEAAGATAPPKFEFARIKSQVVPGDKIGALESGMFCSSHGDLRANLKVEEIANAEAATAFKGELMRLGLTSTTPEVSAFDTAPAKIEPDYRVGGVLQSMSLTECSNGTSRKGDFSIAVKWEVFAPKLQKVVFSMTTTGSFHSDSFETVSGREFETRAYVTALHQMMTDPGFTTLKAVEGPSAAATGSATPGATLAPLHLKSTAAISGGSQANAPALRTAVVTILRDSVSGSGFYVADGYLLTNRHVVGTAHYVKIRLASGRILVGEVVRDDAHRDVALVKTEPAGMPSLHVSMAEPPVGGDVFAIGSPLGQELAGTFTRGVLSGAREVNGLEYLQSDVSVNPGNSGGPLLDASSTAIGMTVLKIDKAAGLSFFIPIRDAANALQLIFD
jgi:serine protease Do